MILLLESWMVISSQLTSSASLPSRIGRPSIQRQIFVPRLVAVGFADEQKVGADGQDLLADGLLRIDVVAQIDRIELAVAQSVQREPAARGSAFTVLLIVTLLGLDEFRSKRQNPILAGFDDAGGHDGMKIIDLSTGVFAGRAIPARQFVRAKILRPIQGDQRVTVQAGQRRQRARGLHSRQSVVEQLIEARRFDVVEHGSNVIVAGNTLHSQQSLAIRPTVSDPFANLTLMRQKRRALHEKRRKPGQSDIPHRKLRVHPPPLVRQARAGPSDTLDQIIEKAHRIVESELDPKHKRLFRKIGAIAKMRIAELRYYLERRDPDFDAKMAEVVSV